MEKGPLAFQFAGVQLTGVRWREDMATFIFNPELGMVVAMVPQHKQKWRSYLGYPAGSGVALQGSEGLERFLTESRRAVPRMAEAYAKAESIGPLASFDVSESWVAHPYRAGVALVGDAAGTSDPSFGKGMGTALRDVRVLRDALVANSDWDEAGHAFAREHDGYFQNCHKVCGWLRTFSGSGRGGGSATATSDAAHCGGYVQSTGSFVQRAGFAGGRSREGAAVRGELSATDRNRKDEPAQNSSDRVTRGRDKAAKINIAKSGL